jgi:superfamily II DNA or RNA helicase
MSGAADRSSSAPSDLRELGQWAVSQGRAYLLHEPLLAFILESNLAGSAARELDAVIRRSPGISLGELLLPAEDASSGRARIRFGSRRLAIIAQALERYLKSSSHRECAEARQKVKPPPGDPEDLFRWAELYGLRPSLSVPACTALERWVRSASDIPASICLVDLVAEERRRKLPVLIKTGDLGPAARALLFAQALQRAAESTSPPRPASADPTAGGVLAALDSLRASLGPAPYDRRTNPSAYSLDLDPVALAASCTLRPDALVGSPRIGERPEVVPPTVEIKLKDWRTPPLQASCNCWLSKPCPHLFGALARCASVLAAPSPPQAEAVSRLLESLARPLWHSDLERLDRALSAFKPRDSGEPEGFVSWNLQSEPYWTLTPYVHRPRKGGGWSPGARIRLAELWEQGPLSFPNASQVRSVLGKGELSIESGSIFEALGLLAGYPHLYLEGEPGRSLEVRRGSLSVDLRLDDAGTAHLAASVDGDEVLGAQLRSRPPAPRMILLDRERFLCALVSLDRAQRALLEALGKGFRLPNEALGELMPRLERMEQVATLDLPPELQSEVVAEDRRLVARLTPQPSGALVLQVLFRPLGSGAAFPPGEGPARVAGFAQGRRVHVERDRPGEEARAAEVLAKLPLPPPDAGGRWRFSLAGEAALDLLAALERQDPTALVAEWPQDGARMRVAGAVGASDLRVRLEDKRDWFGLSGEAELAGGRLSLAVLLDAVRRGSRYAQVGPGHWVEIVAELRAKLEGAADVVFAGRSGLEVSAPAASALEKLLEGMREVQACARFSAAVERLRASRAAEPSLPEGLQAELRPYQVEGYRWLMRMAQWGMGACLADDMGLGKTVQTLAVLLARAPLGPALIAAPTSVCFNWMREAERFCPSLRMRLFREGDRAATLASLSAGDVLVTSYGLLLRHAEELQRHRFATLVLDEAQAIKNPATRRARAVRALEADFRLALTGTPVENHLGELWSLFRVLAPGLLGSWEQFRERFAAPIERLKDPGRRAALARVVRPFILRRTKGKVAPELPPRTELKRLVALSAAERALYEDARALAVAQLSGALDAGEEQRFQALAAITRLRQIACHPRLADAGSTAPSSKLNAFLELVRELEDGGHRALVFSQFTSHLALVREALEQAKVAYLYLDGQTPEPERIRRVDAFQSGEAQLFLISLKAGGTGLNLTAADYVVHLDPWWNPAVEDQATDRAHRIGQDKPVTVYRLVAQGTIEEAILQLHEDKRDLVAGVLDGAAASAKLSTEELLALIRSGESAQDVDLGDDAVGDDEMPPADALGLDAGPRPSVQKSAAS